MRSLSVNLSGRVKNFNLPKNQPLLPLFEAVVNSIHAIEERRLSEPDFTGRITINISREQQTSIPGMIEITPIESFEIIDNGVGFNEANFESFMESDSTYKETYGGKGVGRFSWLKAFEKVEVESIYTDNGEYVQRRFDFFLKQKGFNDTLVDAPTATANRTAIRLIHCIPPYKENLPKKGETVAMRIIQHCLVYFVSSSCPQIDLVDFDQTYNLNQIFAEKIKTENNTAAIQIADERFEILHVKIEDTSVNGNKLFLCAHNRLVETKELEKYIADLDRTIYDKNGFWYIGVLKGSYLDNAVDMNRLSFTIPDNGTYESTGGIITMDEIMNVVVGEVEQFLKDYLSPIAKTKMDKITDYVVNKAPQFRHLLKHMPDSIAKIKPNLSDEKLDDELHRIKRKFDRKTATDNKKLLEDLNAGLLSATDYETRFNNHLSRIISANSSALAEYIAHRKVILDLMRFAIKKTDDGVFQKESFLHNLIYPMRSTSDEISYSAHNLWLIDEKLAYCNYITSDIPFNNNPKETRTDILMLDSPVAVSDEENIGTEYESIVIFELKRPMRNDYKDGDNPITQLYGYVKKLRSGTAKDKDGRVIRVGNRTKFYLYAVCDVTPSLESILDFYNFSQTPDKLGYYMFNDNLNAYVEILSYDKIINDAQKRNKILFDKLGI